MTPNNIDRYEVRGEIGRGGMATVLQGYDPRFKRDVAIKLLPREFLHDPQFRARFQREAQTIAALEHPAIVPVYDFGDADGQLYLVMRLMTGGSLADRLEKGPLSIIETARIFERLAPALDSAHALGIIHRDLKPANILFDQWNNPYLSDFGIAKLVAGSSTALTATGGLVGTPAYMSPEQVRGVDALDGRSDIYAMGIILFQMLTGKLPYNANTPIGLAFMHVTEPVPNILDIDVSLPPAYQSVIDKAMAKERDARPKTTVALADTVSNLALDAERGRAAFGSEAKETLFTSLPDQDEQDQQEIETPETPATSRLPLTALEDELYPKITGLANAELGMQAGAIPQSFTKSDISIGLRFPARAWPVIGIVVVALIVYGVSKLLMGSGDGEEGGVTTTVAAIVPDPIATLTNTVTTTSKPTAIPTVMATPSATFLPTSTNVPAPTPTRMVALPVMDGTAVPQPATLITIANADQVTQLARWGKGIIDEVIYSPDSSLLAVATTLGIYLYDTQTLAEVDFIDAQTSAWNSIVAFSPDGQTVASSTDDGSIQIWSLVDDQLLQTLEGHTDRVLNLTFLPDGQTIVSVSWDGVIYLWSVVDGKLLQTFEDMSTDSVRSVTFSADGQTMASVSTDGTVYLWSVADGQLLQTLEEDINWIGSVTLSADGQIVACGSRDNNIHLWSVANGQLLQTLEGHTSSVSSIAFSSNGQTVASGSYDGTIRLWSVADGQLLQTFEGHTRVVTSVDFSSNGQTVASGSYDGTIRLWSVADGQLLHTFFGVGLSATFSPNGQIVVLGSSDGTILLRSVADGRLLQTLEGHTDAVRSVAFSPDGQTVASGSSDGTLRLWSVADSQLVRTLDGHTDTVWSVAFSPDGQTVASGSSDGITRLWSVADGQLLHTLEGHNTRETFAVFSPGGQTVASGSGAAIRLWSVADGRSMQTLYATGVLSLAFSPDGQTLASGSSDDIIRLWSVADGQLLRNLKGHTSWVQCVAFSPDGQTIASGSSDGTIWLWSVVDGQLLYTLEGHTDDVNSVAFSPDGLLLLSSSDDNTIRLWGVP